MPPHLTVLRGSGSKKGDFKALMPFPPLPRIPTELLLNFLLQELHFLGFPVDQEHIAGLSLADQLHDALGIGVGTEGHVLHLHLHLQLQGAEHSSWELGIPLKHTQTNPDPSGFHCKEEGENLNRLDKKLL